MSRIPIPLVNQKKTESNLSVALIGIVTIAFSKCFFVNVFQHQQIAYQHSNYERKNNNNPFHMSPIAMSGFNH